LAKLSPSRDRMPRPEAGELEDVDD
jgi:hypothetical protein